jgi:hypothetical protein
MSVGATPLLPWRVFPGFQAAHPTLRNSFKREIELGRQVIPRKARQRPIMGLCEYSKVAETKEDWNGWFGVCGGNKRTYCEGFGRRTFPLGEHSLVLNLDGD